MSVVSSSQPSVPSRQRIGQEGFVARSSDIDLAYIYGYGFPPAKAGILCTCTVGAKAFQFRCRGLGCAQICASEHSVKPACRVPLKQCAKTSFDRAAPCSTPRTMPGSRRSWSA